MKPLLLLAALLLSLFVNGQTTPLLVPGTKISMIPPPGFTVASGFSGFQQKSLTASIVASEMPVAVSSAISGFNADALKLKGMVLVDKQTIEHHGQAGAMIKVMQFANGVNYIKQILLFGDDKKTLIINGIYPESNKSLETDIQTALLSATYDDKVNIDPLKIATFTLDTKGTGLVFTSHVSGSWLYTVDGKAPTQSPDMVVFIASFSTGTAVIADKKQFAIDRLRKLPRGESSVVKETNPITIDQLSGYEIVADGKDANGKKQLVYEVILYTDDNGYYIMTGSSIGKMETYLAHFRSIARSFKEK